MVAMMKKWCSCCWCCWWWWCCRWWWWWWWIWWCCCWWWRRRRRRKRRRRRWWWWWWWWWRWWWWWFDGIRFLSGKDQSQIISTSIDRDTLQVYNFCSVTYWSMHWCIHWTHDHTLKLMLLPTFNMPHHTWMNRTRYPCVFEDLMWCVNRRCCHWACWALIINSPKWDLVHSCVSSGRWYCAVAVCVLSIGHNK